jgi:hypothetical protein
MPPRQRRPPRRIGTPPTRPMARPMPTWARTKPPAAIAQSTRPPSASARPEWRGPPGRLHRSARGGRARLTRCPSSAWSPEQRPLPRSRAVVAGGHGRWQCTRGRGALTRASSNGVVGQAACKLPYATTLWLLDAVARHATAASSDLFCVPFRGARQRARLPTVQTTPPAAPGALYSAFAPQAVLRALPLPAARAEACGCRPPHARRLRVRRRLPHAARPPNTRLTPACRVCRLQPESEVRAGVSHGAEGGAERRAHRRRPCRRRRAVRVTKLRTSSDG